MFLCLEEYVDFKFKFYKECTDQDNPITIEVCASIKPIKEP
jgi:hypothetical protein